MKLLLITLLLLTSFFGFTQSDSLDTRRDFGTLDYIIKAINTAEDALYYSDSLEMEYEKSPFYIISYFNTDEGEKIDGKIIIADLKIIHLRLSELTGTEEIDKNHKKLIEAADSYYDKKNYEKAYSLYVRAHNIKPSDKKTSKKMKKAEDFLSRQKSVRIRQ
jgi:hypothetical protein